MTPNGGEDSFFLTSHLFIACDPEMISAYGKVAHKPIDPYTLVQDMGDLMTRLIKPDNMQTVYEYSVASQAKLRRLVLDAWWDTTLCQVCFKLDKPRVHQYSSPLSNVSAAAHTHAWYITTYQYGQFHWINTWKSILANLTYTNEVADLVYSQLQLMYAHNEAFLQVAEPLAALQKREGIEFIKHLENESQDQQMRLLHTQSKQLEQSWYNLVPASRKPPSFNDLIALAHFLSELSYYQQELKLVMIDVLFARRKP
jgi:hypothetical protein